MTRNAAATSVRPADPCCFVIFGASGDLTHRLLIPALYNLAVGGLLPDAFCDHRGRADDAFERGLPQRT